jgi:hypothetical protein
MMATMTRYPGMPKIISAAILVLGKYPDKRTLPFIEKFRKEYSPKEESSKSLDDLAKKILDTTSKGSPKTVEPVNCDSLQGLAEMITKSDQKEEVLKAIQSLGTLDCKEAVAYLYFLNNLSYLNKGDDLFGNETYFNWDTKNTRYSMDLKRKEKYSDAIGMTYRNLLEKTGLNLNEVLKLLASKYDAIWVGVDSSYFSFLFAIPYKAQWDLSKKELMSLANNVLYTDAGYDLKKYGKIYKISKARMLE